VFIWDIGVASYDGHLIGPSAAHHGHLAISSRHWHLLLGPLLCRSRAPLASHHWHLTIGISPLASHHWHLTIGISPLASHHWHLTIGILSVSCHTMIPSFTRCHSVNHGNCFAQSNGSICMCCQQISLYVSILQYSETC